MAFTPREAPRSVTQPVVITDAPWSKSEDVSRREHRYLWTMVFRTACFVGLFVVPMGWWQIGLVVGAALLPPLAVVLANAADNRTTPSTLTESEQHDVPALASPHVIPGDVE